MEVFESSLRIKHREQLFSWLQGLFQYLLPHEVLICAYRLNADESFSYEKFVSTRYFRDEHFAEVVAAESGLLSKIMHAWLRVQHPVLIDESLELGDFSTYSTPFQLGKAAMQSLELKNAAGHGLVNANGDIMTFFFFARIGSNPLSPRQAYLLELFVPFLHSMLTRVLVKMHGSPNAYRIYSQKNPKQKTTSSRVTYREQEILKWIQAGKTNHEIAQILAISPLTVKNHVHNILKKLGVENRSNACHKARKMGLVN